MFCSLKNLKYIGERKEHKETPKWCPKRIIFGEICQKIKIEKKKEDKMKRRKERRGLQFRVSLEFLNLVFDLIKKRKYKLIPKDVEIHRISPWDPC